MVGPQQTVSSSQQGRPPDGGTTGGLGLLDAPPRALPAPGSAHLFRQLWGRRAVRFGAVAASCTAIQLLVLAGLARLGVSTLVANAIGFVLSAQANFVLSAQLTWRDRKPHSSSPRARSMRWARFNAVAVIALVVNELVFTLGVHAGARLLPAAAAGILVGAALTFTLNNFVTFRAKPEPHSTNVPSANVPQECRPDIEDISERAQRDGVAFFLPAFNEATNLRLIVPGIVDYFRQLDCPFTVIIVDDGSTQDDTFEAAEQLARSYPRFVQAVHHTKNQGYGAALQTGFRAALDTGHGLIGFCDADDQFEIASFGTLVAALQNADADLAVGYRIARADSLKRRVMGRAWHWLSSLVLGSKAARDVDCGFKVFTRTALKDVAPRISGSYAAVSPEIIARAVAAGYTMVEAGVTHKTRSHGRQTGSDLKVVLFSLTYLFQLRLTLRGEG
jgi:putative flippase GtrA